MIQNPLRTFSSAERVFCNAYVFFFFGFGSGVSSATKGSSFSASSRFSMSRMYCSFVPSYGKPQSAPAISSDSYGSFFAKTVLSHTVSTGFPPR